MSTPIRSFPTPLQSQIIWTGIAAFFATLTGAIAIGAVVLTGRVLGFLQPILVPVLVAAILAYLLAPIVAWLRKLGWNRRLAGYFVYVSALLFFLVLAFLVINPSVRQARDFWADYLTPAEVAPVSVEGTPPAIANPDVAASGDADKAKWIQRTKLGAGLQRFLDLLDEKVGALPWFDDFREDNDASKWDSGEIGAWLWAKLGGFVDEVVLYFGRGLSGAASLFGYILGFLLVPVYLFFFLHEGTAIARTWSNYLPLREGGLKREVVKTVREINGYLIAYFRGQMLVSIIDGVLVAIALKAIGLPYAMLLGVFLALLGLIPYIGSILVMIPAVLIAIVHFNQEPWAWLPNQLWAYPLIVIGIIMVSQQINAMVTAPKIIGDAVGLHPLTVIFSMLFWGLLLGGLLGAILAVPLTASVKVLFQRYVWDRRIRRRDGETPSPEPG